MSGFFSICNKTLKLKSENRKTKKKSFIGSATGVNFTIILWGRGVRSKVLRPSHFQGGRSEGRFSREAIKADRKWEGVLKLN